MSTVQSRKAKGRQGEKDVIAILGVILAEVYAELGLGPAPELARSPHGRDIRGIPWISIEVKRHEPSPGYPEVTKQQIKGWWDQCKTNTLEGQTSVLIYRANHQPWRVRMFGLLPAGALDVRCPVDIDLEAFQAWFRTRLRHELKPPVKVAS